MTAQGFLAWARRAVARRSVVALYEPRWIPSDEEPVASDVEESQDLQPLVRLGWVTSITVSAATFVCGLVLGAAGGGSTTAARNPMPAPTVTMTVTATPAGPPINADGTFEVGADIQPGTYSSTKLGCFWARSSSDTVIASRLGDHEVVTVEPTDEVFESLGCAPWTRVAEPGREVPVPWRPVSKPSAGQS